MNRHLARILEDRVLHKLFIADSLELAHLIKPAGTQEAVMYIVSAISGELARRLLHAVVWESRVHSPEIATAVSAITRQNISSKKKPLPILREGEGILFVAPKPELDADAPLELDWNLIALAFTAPIEEEGEKVEETEEPEFQDCSTCESASRCFKSNIEA